MMRRQLRGVAKKYYGKYRGKVENDFDPLFLGRIQARVAILPNSSINWCMPCVPYAGAGVGFYAIPPIGANVWIEFEGGNPNFPIWTGCFWGEGEVPVVTEEPPNPLVKVFKTEFATLMLNDTPEIGGITLKCMPPAVNDILSMVFDAIGITLSAPPATVKMIPEEGITLTFPPDIIAMTEETIEITVPPSTLTMTPETIAIEAPAISATAEGEVSVNAGGAATIGAGADLSLSAGGVLSGEAGAETSLSAGAAMTVTAGADLTMTAAIVMIN